MCSNKYYLGDKTTVQSNSHLIFTLQFKIWSKWGTPMRLCRGLTCLNNVFMFHHKLLPSALLPHGIAPKWNKLIGYHSSSFPLWYYCDCRGLHLNVRNDPSSNVLLRHLPLFCCCSGVTLTSKYVLKLTVWAHWYFQFQWGEKRSPPLAIVTCQIGAPLMLSFYTCGYALTSRWNYLLIKLTQISCSGTENSDFPISE